jgi:ABC-type sugar transport system substrate-binding protein
MRQVLRAFLLLVCLAPLPWAEMRAAEDEPFVIGFSQATTTEPWRLLFNKELRAEHEGVLTATFLTMTPGAEGLRQAIKLLRGDERASILASRSGGIR